MKERRVKGWVLNYLGRGHVSTYPLRISSNTAEKREKCEDTTYLFCHKVTSNITVLHWINWMWRFLLKDSGESHIFSMVLYNVCEPWGGVERTTDGLELLNVCQQSQWHIVVAYCREHMSEGKWGGESGLHTHVKVVFCWIIQDL